jgi:RNA polymerase sigma-70 factor (ECF subfamily)
MTSLTASGADPLHSTIAEERGATLRAAVAALDEPYREVVSLRYFGELSLEEVSMVTGRNLNTVKTQIRRGLHRLAGTMRSEEVE